MFDAKTFLQLCKDNNGDPGKIIASLYYFSEEREVLQFVGENEFLFHHSPKAYQRYMEFKRKLATEEMLKGQAFGL